MKYENLKLGVVVKVTPSGVRYNAFDKDGEKYNVIPTGIRKDAYNNDKALKLTELAHHPAMKPGRRKWVEVEMSEFDTPAVPVRTEPIEVPEGHTETMAFIHGSYNLKPRSLVMNELKWKFLIRSAVRGKNIMMTGPAGSGKTMSAKALVTSLDRPDYYFNMGATQDPRATLIGNVHYDPDRGTYMAESLFVKAIQTPNAVILLDELTRAHPDAWNILMPVLDYGQRYLRLDEKADQATIKVAEGVTFIATANIGNEYTDTRMLDKALLDRFTVIEIDVLNEDEEKGLLTYMFPHVESEVLGHVAKIAHLTRIESINDNPRIDSGISTRTSVELAGLIYDGFELKDAAEITIYPQYDTSGGVDSERTFVKQIVQKFIDDGTAEELFTEEEIASS
jgi:nitric oxide reductase NorQ protein